jgi:Mrp family chromosome partitioning ATPase
MTTLGLTPEIAVVAELQRVPVAPVAEFSPTVSRVSSVYDEQIQSLVQMLFIRQTSGPVRHVGFAAVDPHTETAQMCLDVATALAESGPRDIGLIDARLRSEPLHTQLRLAPGNRSDASWLIAPRLWLAPRRKWLDENSQRVWDPSLSKLRATTLEFDFSVLCFDPVNWLTARLGQSCDGVVMVLTAGKTRRLVAARMYEQLRQARIPVLGTVLAERHFPVPAGLYRNL